MAANNSTTALPPLPYCPDDVCKTMLLILEEPVDSIDYSDISQAFWLWFTVAVFGPLCVLGLVGNIMTIVVFAMHIKQTTTTVFIISLAVVDAIVCGVQMPMLWYEEFGIAVDEIFCKFTSYLVFLVLPMSSFILLAIAIDRFLLIFMAKPNIITIFRAKIEILVLSLICIAFGIPRILGMTTIRDVDTTFFCEPGEGESTFRCATGVCLASYKYFTAAALEIHHATLLYMFLLVVLVFAAAYALIFWKVYRMHKKMTGWKKRNNTNNTGVNRVVLDDNTFATTQLDYANASNANQPEHLDDDKNDSKALMPANSEKVVEKKKKKKQVPHFKTAITLALVTFTFIIAYVPMMIITWFQLCADEEGTPTTEVVVGCPKNSVSYFFWHFYYFNHIMNPVIYAFMNPRFMEALKTCIKWKEKKPT